MNKDTIRSAFTDAKNVMEFLSSDEPIQDQIIKVAETIIHTYNNGGKVLFCGNGGSAADAQHLAAELSGRFYFDRDPLYAEALHVNTSYLTAVANDFGYEHIFSRLISAKGKSGDVLICLSTSGNSNNILEAAKKAASNSMVVIGMTGQDGGSLASLCQYHFRIPSDDTPRVQEAHLAIGHMICQLVEKSLFQS